MFKEFIIVGIGSFFGGGMRLLVSRGMQAIAILPFPFGTFLVNIIGCLLFGFISGLPSNGAYLSPTTKLLLTTGFCGGFTTLSTFMGESAILMRGNSFTHLVFYLSASLAIGMLAMLAGHWAAKMV